MDEPIIEVEPTKGELEKVEEIVPEEVPVAEVEEGEVV